MVQFKTFSYRSESSRDSRVESSRSDEILKNSKKFVFQFLSIKTSLALFFVSHVSMKFEYTSLVKSFFRQFSVGFTYFRSVSCFAKLDPNFSICITQLQTIVNLYYARLYDS